MYYSKINSTSSFVQILGKIFIYATTTASVAFLLMDYCVLASSYYPDFLFPFILALTITIIKYMNIVGYFYVLKKQYRVLGRTMVTIGLTMLFINLVMNIIYLASLIENFIIVITNISVLYYTLVVVTDIIVLIIFTETTPSYQYQQIGYEYGYSIPYHSTYMMKFT